MMCQFHKNLTKIAGFIRVQRTSEFLLICLQFCTHPTVRHRRIIHLPWPKFSKSGPADKWIPWTQFIAYTKNTNNKLKTATFSLMIVKNLELHVCIVQNAPIHQSHIYRQIKVLRTIFEKGHPRNIHVKLFQNLTSGFGEKSLRISSCPYSAKSLHSPEPYLLTYQNFAHNFWKGSLKEYSCEIILKSDKQFRRRRFFKNFFMSLKCEKPPFTRAMFMDGSKFREHFLKRVT